MRAAGVAVLGVVWLCAGVCGSFLGARHANGERESVCIVTPGLPLLFECIGADDWCRDRHLQCVAEDIGSYQPAPQQLPARDLVEEGWL